MFMPKTSKKLINGNIYKKLRYVYSMVNIKNLTWKQFYLIMLGIILFLSLLIIMLDANKYDIRDYVKDVCYNADDVLPLLVNENIEYEIVNNHGECYIKYNGNGIDENKNMSIIKYGS